MSHPLAVVVKWPKNYKCLSPEAKLRSLERRIEDRKAANKRLYDEIVKDLKEFKERFGLDVLKEKFGDEYDEFEEPFEGVAPIPNRRASVHPDPWSKAYLILVTRWMIWLGLIFIVIELQPHARDSSVKKWMLWYGLICVAMELQPL